MPGNTRSSPRRLPFVIVFVAALILPVLASARIEKLAVPSKQGLSLYWWPKLAPVKGWHHDEEASRHYGVNAEVPDGYAFSNAGTVIYAKAIYKPREPEMKSLQMLIASDKAMFEAHNRQIKIAKVGSLRTADGRILTSYSFFPKKKGNWEETSYGEEGQFYLIFVISSRSKAGYEKALPVYKMFVSRYQ